MRKPPAASPRGPAGRTRPPAAPRGPGLTQIHAQRLTRAGRLRAKRMQRLRLGLQDLRLIELKQAGVARPAEPIGTRVQPRGQQHYLPNPRLARDALQEIIEEAG